MPARDTTGPLGAGPRTGRGLGRCNPKNDSEQSFYGRGRSRGLGRGYGRWGGFGYARNQSPISLEEEKKVLENRLADIEKALNK